MGTTIRTDGFPAQGTVLDTRDDLVGAVAVIEGAHDLQVRLAAFRAWFFFYDEVTGMALIFTLIFRNIVQSLVSLSHCSLIRSPIHTITSHKSLINF